MTPKLTIDFSGGDWEPDAGIVTCVCEVEATQPIWAAEASIAGRACEVPYDGGPTRMLITGHDVEIVHRPNGRRVVLQTIAMTVQISQEHLVSRRVAVPLNGRLVVRVLAEDAEGRPAPGVEVKILSAVPESISAIGVTDGSGVLTVLAPPGPHAIVAGRERHPPIEVTSQDAGERIVRIRYVK